MLGPRSWAELGGTPGLLSQALSPRGGHPPALPPPLPHPVVLFRMKPVGSVNDVALDALDLDRMKQVSVTFPGRP